MENADEKMEEFFRRIVERSPDPICVVINDQVTYANQACAQLLGLKDPHELFSKPFTTFITDEQVEPWKLRVSTLLEGVHLPTHDEFVLKHSSGDRIVVEISEYFFTQYGKPALQLIMRDVSHRKAMEQALEESEARYKGLADAAFDGVVIHVNGFIENVNRAFETIFGYPHASLNGKAMVDIIAEEDRQAFLDHVSKPRNENIELRGLRKDGKSIIIEISSQRCYWEARDAFTSAIRDVTARREAEEQVRRQAFYDSLTSLPNRTLFQDRLLTSLNTARRKKHRLAVLFMDLDRFKAVNDTLGHDAGDKLLEEAAYRIASCVRREDTVSRLGGDEFTVLLSEINRVQDVQPVARKIIDAMARPFEVGGETVHIGVTIGASVFPEHSQEPDELLKKADLAMYRAKKNGRNQLQIYREEADPDQKEKMGLEQQLRKAIESDEFTLHYQPWINLKTNRIAGAEALIRWNHPQRGMVFPDGFIDLAEDTRLIIPIGEWVLREACRKARAWQEQGLEPVPVSVNLSAWQLHKQSLVRTVDKALALSGLDPSFLRVEITESVAMQNAEFSLSILNSLTARGIGVALDDFGKGYSSLTYLKQFPVRILKIDKGFVQDLHKNPKDQAIVSAVIQLAHNLGIRVVAEGVENNSQLNFIKGEGCDMVQGYLYAKPLPAAEFEELLGRNESIEV